MFNNNIELNIISISPKIKLDRQVNIHIMAPNEQ